MKLLPALLLLSVPLVAQTRGADATPQKALTAVDSAAAGDQPADPGPLASDLSRAVTRADIRAAMHKVALWQMEHIGLAPAHFASPRFNQQWTDAALYDGLLAYSRDTGDAVAHNAVVRAAESFQWKLLDNRFPHADDEALGQAYLDLYAEHPAPERIAATRAVMDRLIARPDDPSKPVWWWCDALFMAPPVLVRLAAITGDHKYIDYMNREWEITATALYDSNAHLYFRDARFLDFAKQHEANGEHIFWSRGNGWVLAALVNLLEYLPPEDPARARYTQQFREMANRVVRLQGPDGLWRAGLLDYDDYKYSEVSGSAFFTFAFAYGVRTGLLDRATFEPAIRKSWSAMVAHIYADGRLGSIQPIGAAPDAFAPSSSYVYGVGAFLLAGSEIDRMLAKTK